MRATSEKDRKISGQHLHVVMLTKYPLMQLTQ